MRVLMLGLGAGALLGGGGVMVALSSRQGTSSSTSSHTLHSSSALEEAHHPSEVKLPVATTMSIEPEADNGEAELPIIFPLPSELNGAMFIGHNPSPDCDSVASALAGAHLWKGVATVPSAINKESEFLLKRFNTKAPALVDDVYKGGPFVLVDHNDVQQVAKILTQGDARKQIVGIIDHHALSSTPFPIDQPTFVEILPWGSCASIMASKFLSHGISIPPSLAGVMVGAIVSDTLNLKSPTTTIHDKKILDWLAPQVEWDTKFQKGDSFDYSAAISDLATHQFQAKANLTGMSQIQKLTSDFKIQTMPNGAKIGWGAVETVEPFYSEYISEALLKETVNADNMGKIQQDKQAAMVFISFVDIGSDPPRSTVVCMSTEQCAVATKAFPDGKATPIAGTTGMSIDTSPFASRKSQFVPALVQEFRREFM